MSDHYDPSLDAIVRTERFVDALAGGARMSSVDPLSAMLGGWRDEVRSQPDAHVVTFEQASAALARGQKPLRRNRIGLTVVGAAAAAVLCLGGFGAVVYDAGPGDALYGLRSMLFGEVATPRTDAVTLAAKELDQVQQLVDQGNWDAAQQKLISLGPTVQSVDDAQSKQGLVQQYNLLTAKVIERNPAATPPPPDAPPPPVNPQSPLSFLPLPVIETTTSSPSIDTNLMISPPAPSSSSSSPSPTSSSSPSSSSTSSPSPSSPTSSASPKPSPSSSSAKPSPSPSPSQPPVASKPSAPPVTVTSPAVQAPAPSAEAPSAAAPTPTATPAPSPRAKPRPSAKPKKPEMPPTSEVPEPKQGPKVR